MWRYGIVYWLYDGLLFCNVLLIEQTRMHVIFCEFEETVPEGLAPRMKAHMLT